MDEMKILVADREAEFRRLCRRDLEKEGYQVLTASNQEEMLRIAGETDPDLIVLDIRLPGGAIDALARTLGEDRAPRVILTSGSVVWDEGFMVWLADACVARSKDFTRLKEVVRNLLASEPIEKVGLEAT